MEVIVKKVIFSDGGVSPDGTRDHIVGILWD